MNQIEHILVELIGNIEGDVIYDSKRYAKKELLNLIDQRKEEIKPFDSIVLKGSASPLWWAYYFAAMLSGKRILLLDDVQTEEQCNNDLQYLGKCAYIELLSENITKKQITQGGSVSLHLEEAETVLYTTGTTGIPKGVVISLSTLLHCLRIMNERYCINANDSSLHVLNLAHSMGLSFGLICFLSGGDFYACANSMNYYRTLLKRNVTVTMVPPTLFGELLKLPDFENRMKMLRFISTGGARINPAYVEKAKQCDVKFINGYGMTECVIASGDVNDSEISDALWPLSEVEIKISENDEIWVRGKSVNKYYLNGTSIVDQDGWIHTSDTGYLMEKQLYITGRRDDVVSLANGYKIDMVELEERICSLPEVSDACVKNKDGNVVVEIVSGKNIDEEIDKLLRFHEEVTIKYVDDIKLFRGKKIRIEKAGLNRGGKNGKRDN